MVFDESFQSLKSYCETQNYAGWDPYDGLNSKIFQKTSFKRWSLPRLVLIQSFKRSPINFRRLLLVPKEHNAKGIGLFLSGYCKIYNVQQMNGKEEYGTQHQILEKIYYLANLLIQMQSEGYSGACWGYNFDWQARFQFLFPKYTPTVVATTFATSALFEAYEVTKKKEYLATALSSAKFILNDLNKTKYGNDGFILSYSPLNGNNTVINASLLGAKTLILCYHYSRNEELLDTARTIVKTACELQQDDGAWVYGLMPFQNWIDSYHTGYNLEALSFYQKISGDQSFSTNIDKGYKFYISNFFESDGTPIHFIHSKYPIDIHCPGQLFVTMNALNITDVKDLSLADKVLHWTINNMQSRKGYFYYQLKRSFSSKIPYMRWSNAFMFNALSNYLLLKSYK